MVTFSLVILLETINVFKVDFYGTATLTDKELITCRFLGFLTYETFGCCYMTFVLQAFYRLTRVVYSKYKFLQAFSFNLICIVLQWIIYFLLLLPSYFWPGSLYSFYESDYYCGIPYEKIVGLSYTIMNIFAFPIIYLTIMYSRCLHFIRNHAPQLSQERRRRRAKRDLMITRRILFTVIALTLPGVPNLTFVLITSIDVRLSGSFYMYRIQWMGPAVTIFILSIGIVFINSQIKQIFIKLKFCGNQVVPIKATMRELRQPSVLLATQI
ncbi:unnamed protein product [Rotaria sp. Silwood2]|nr:unnamed protein product [Rotaria sp. Silwood2]CAF2757336.1 unnamed protein product [Rotaria sp. Silwood2]CAF3938636.1 unnamed protein product [Rotaria sp. Silwood2]CAF4378900.1 unnamed protein product [Rotaria sp. Silwood2]